MLILIIAAILPAVVLLAYILRKDRLNPEPRGWLVKGFFYGMLSAPASLLISGPLGALGFYPQEATTVLGHVCTAFFGAGVPEELTKLFFLWLLLRRNPHFDENFDGIVYAVSIGMGFAFVENLEYIFASGNAWFVTGVCRGLVSVPGHYAFAVLMGYYYSHAHFGTDHRTLYAILTALVPIVFHGLFDSILMVSNAQTHSLLSVGLTVVFFFVFIRMQKLCHRDIMKQLAGDGVL